MEKEGALEADEEGHAHVRRPEGLDAKAAVVIRVALFEVDCLRGGGTAVAQYVFGEEIADVRPCLPPSQDLPVEVVGVEVGGKDVQAAGIAQQAVVHDAPAVLRVAVVVYDDRHPVRLDGEAAVVYVIQFHAAWMDSACNITKNGT